MLCVFMGLMMAPIFRRPDLSKWDGWTGSEWKPIRVERTARDHPTGRRAQRLEFQPLAIERAVSAWSPRRAKPRASRRYGLPVPEALASPRKPIGGQWNEIRFRPVEAARLRVVFHHQAGSKSGVSEILVWER